MKIALVYDYLTQFGGGERVLAVLSEMFPEAPIFTLIYDKKTTNGIFKNKKIYTSFLQKIPGSKKFFRGLIWLMPLAIEQFDLSGFDLVVSVSHSFGKGIITKPGTKHICYCLTPNRYLWDNSYFPFKPFSGLLLTYLRNWDYQAAQRPDNFIACSENVKQRIKKYYGRDSEVIYPFVEKPLGYSHFGNARPRISYIPLLSPVPTEPSLLARLATKIFPSIRLGSRGSSTAIPCGLFETSYFLMVGRLVPYKRFDIAIEAFAKLPNEKLLIIGSGPEYKKLKAESYKLKAKNIQFLGQVSDSELSKYYANCEALIFPQEEDFGIVPLEAMAFGRPVIAYRAGGVLETVKEGEEGLFFDKQTPDSLVEAVKEFEHKKFNYNRIIENAKRFDKEIFKDKIRSFIARY